MLLWREQTSKAKVVRATHLITLLGPAAQASDVWRWWRGWWRDERQAVRYSCMKGDAEAQEFAEALIDEYIEIRCMTHKMIMLWLEQTSMKKRNVVSPRLLTTRVPGPLDSLYT